MQTGMINSENLGQILRVISQKRQNGILEITFPEKQLQIMFFAGRIVDAQYFPSKPTSELLVKLSNAGYVKGQPETEPENYKELFLWLNSRGPDSVLVDENVFRNAIRHRILDILYSLNLETPAIYVFKMQMPDFDKDFTSSVSVGQMLLDRVSLETEKDRFNSLFPPNCRIIAQDISGLSLSEEEQNLYNAIGSGISKEELISRTIVSIFHVQSGLLSLHERAIIEVEAGSAPLAAAVNADLVSALEVSTERPFVESEHHPSPQVKKVASVAIEQAPVAEKIPEPQVIAAKPKVKRSQKSLSVINATLLQDNAVLNIVCIIFALVALAIPIFFWRSWLASF